MVSPIADGIVPWPEEPARAYAPAGWWRGQALGTELAAVAHAWPARDRPGRWRDPAQLQVPGARADALATPAHRRARAWNAATGSWSSCRTAGSSSCSPSACLRAGIVPVMALPAHRQHELAYLCEHSEARALAIPGMLRDFDHQDMAANGCGPARRRCGTSW